MTPIDMLNADTARDLLAKRKQEFVETCKHGRTPTLLRHIADHLDGQRDPYYRNTVEWLDDAFLAFGVEDTIKLVAQAHREREIEHNELLDRR